MATGLTGMQFIVNGGNGNDIVVGSAGDDILHGDAGDDVLIGGPGQDVLDQGTGSGVVIQSPVGAPSGGGAALLGQSMASTFVTAGLGQGARRSPRRRQSSSRSWHSRTLRRHRAPENVSEH